MIMNKELWIDRLHFINVLQELLYTFHNIFHIFKDCLDL